MMRKSIPLIVIAFLSIVSATGCWDRVEINDVALIAGSAMDKAGDKYKVSVQIPLPGQMGGESGGGGGTSGTKPYYVESTEGKTIREANEILQSTLSRRLNFSHRRVLIIGEDLAREGVSPLLDVLIRVPPNRLSSLAAVTKGKAQDVLNAEAPIEQFPAEMIRELAQQSIKDIPTLKWFTEHLLKEGIDPILPYMSLVKTQPGREGESKTSIKVDGIAVFRQGKLAGVVKGKESKFLLIAMNQASRPVYQVKAPEGTGFIEVEFQQIQTSMRPRIKGDEISITLEVKGRGSIVENHSNYDVTSDGNVQKIEKMVDSQLSAGIVGIIQTLQTRLHADPLGFGDTLYREHPKHWETIKKDWIEDVYPRVKVDVSSHIHLEHTGSITKPLGRPERNLVK